MQRTLTRQKDRVAKCLGIYSASRLYSDWKITEPDDATRKGALWNDFIMKMQLYYKPTENMTLKNFQFRELSQQNNESLQTFCNQVYKEAKHCDFKCTSAACTAEDTAVRDQIVIGMKSDDIRQEALKNSWALKDLRTNGMRMESASKGAAEISGENPVNKLGKYSYRNMNSQKTETQRMIKCYFCGTSTTQIRKHAPECPARKSKCNECGKTGHYAKVCKSKKN